MVNLFLIFFIAIPMATSQLVYHCSNARTDIGIFKKGLRRTQLRIRNIHIFYKQQRQQLVYTNMRLVAVQYRYSSAVTRIHMLMNMLKKISQFLMIGERKLSRMVLRDVRNFESVEKALFCMTFKTEADNFGFRIQFAGDERFTEKGMEYVKLRDVLSYIYRKLVFSFDRFNNY